MMIHEKEIEIDQKQIQWKSANKQNAQNIAHKKWAQSQSQAAVHPLFHRIGQTMAQNIDQNITFSP